MNDARRKKLEDLTEQGYARLEEKEYEAAIEIARKLEKMRYTAAFEIAALAHAGMNDLDAAVKVLERGVRKAQGVWLNWQLLGNYYSDMERYDEASTCYEKALACPNAWEDSVRLNQAILANRREQYDEALVYLDSVKDPHLALQAGCSRVDALEGVERLDEAESLAEELLHREWKVDGAGEYLAGIAADLARIRLGRGQSTAEVRRFVFEALDHHEDNPSLLAALRDLDGRYSPKARYYRLLVHVRIHEDDILYAEMKGYYVNYDLVAEGTEDAREMVREFEKLPVTENLTIEEMESVEPRPDEPMGVYWRSARISYAAEEEPHDGEMG